MDSGSPWQGHRSTESGDAPGLQGTTTEMGLHCGLQIKATAGCKTVAERGVNIGSPGGRVLCVRAVAVRAVATVAASVAFSAAARPPGRVEDVGALLARVGEQVERYFARAQSIVCRETVRLQSLGADLMTDGSHVRQLVYELRMAWDPPSNGDGPPDANVLREIITIDGRPPRPQDAP